MGDPAREKIVRCNAGARQTDQFRARAANCNDLKWSTAIRTGRVQIQNDFTRLDPEQMTAAHVAGDGKDVDMPRLDRQHLLAIVKQSGMTRVERHPLGRTARGRVFRGFAAGQAVGHSVITSFA